VRATVAPHSSLDEADEGRPTRSEPVCALETSSPGISDVIAELERAIQAGERQDTITKSQPILTSVRQVLLAVQNRQDTCAHVPHLNR
jgi:hypothetical protein